MIFAEYQIINLYCKGFIALRDNIIVALNSNSTEFIK